MASEIKDEAFVSFRNLGVFTNTQKPLLSNVSAYIAKGKITAVMGGSGCGKSVLMKVIASRFPCLNISGEILLNGLDTNLEELKRHIGFVPQEDFLSGELTARETFRFAALTKRNKSPKSIETDVQNLIEALGLSEVSDVSIGTVLKRGLSGGQKKRVSIGAELIAAPDLLLLDEPTSGLDSFLAFEIINSIKKIVKAGNGRLSVVVNIHQPNMRILELIDNLLILGGGGMFFFGTVQQCHNYLSEIGCQPPADYTPTDYFLQISHPMIGTRKDIDFEDLIDDDELVLRSFIQGTGLKASFLRQYLTLMKREFLIIQRDTALVSDSILRLGSSIFDSAKQSMDAIQTVMNIFILYAGFAVPWNQTPHYWKWMQEISFFTHSLRATMIHVLDGLHLKCALSASYDDDTCIGPTGEIFDCDLNAGSGDGYCYVHGRTVLHKLQGTSFSASHWTSFSYLILIFVIVRLGILFLMYYPIEVIIAYWNQWRYDTIGMKEIINLKGTVRLIEGQLHAFLFKKTDHRRIEKQSRNIQSFVHASGGEFNDLFTIDSLSELDDNNSSNSHIKSSTSYLVWKNLTVTLKSNNKILIDKVNGIARSGHLLALMGPSGAGKTTLLNALGKRAPYANITGDVTFATRPFVSSDLFYVPQYDELNPNLTVTEQIELVGLLRCTNINGMKSRLTDLIHVMGLAVRTKIRCCNLSGGEQKRVSVCMGMISAPSVLFLDEPTTSLDSATSLSMMEHLVEMADFMNVAVIVTIHQPSSMVFDMMQDLLLLQAGGRLAYSGPLPAVKTYFSNLGYNCPNDVCIADFILDTISNSPDENKREGVIIDTDTITVTATSWEDFYTTSRFGINYNQFIIHAMDNNNNGSTSETFQVPTSFMRIQYMMSLFWKMYCRETGYYLTRGIFLLILAFCIGTYNFQLPKKTEYIGRISGTIFIHTWIALLSVSQAGGLYTIDCREQIELIKNSAVTPSVICIAQFLVSMPFNFLVSVIYNVMFFWLTNISDSGETFIFVIFLTFGYLLLMEAILLLLVQVFRSGMLSMTCYIIVIGGFLLFCGFYTPAIRMAEWVGWLCYIMPTKYGFDGYLAMVYKGQSYELSQSLIVGSTMSGEDILTQLFNQQLDVQPWFMFLVLMAFVVLFRLMYYFLFVIQMLPYLK
eukprot:gene9437-19601_t